MLNLGFFLRFFLQIGLLTCRAAESTSTATSSTAKSGPMGTANRMRRRPSASVTIGTMPGPGAGRRCGGRWNGSSITSRDAVSAVRPSRQCIRRVSTKSGRSTRRSIVCQSHQHFHARDTTSSSFITLAVSSGKRNASVWCPSVRLSVCLSHLFFQR